MNPHVDLAAMRQSYTLAGLDESELAPTWWQQFDRWLTEAAQAGLTEPNAMVIATVDADGRPSTRTVLAKQVSAAGVTFYTNYESDKSRDLAGNPAISVTFPWLDLQRQVQLRGRVRRVDPAVTAEYWRVRPRPSQIGAWASPQSRPVTGRDELAQLLADADARFAAGEVPPPDHWGGWLIEPHSVEFWQGRVARMHDRLRFVRSDQGWAVHRLAP